MPSPADQRVVVIGAGFAGLSAALHLRGRGYEVTVLEREATPGGRSARIERGGYSFDIGATVLTMPGLIGDAFAAVGVDLADALPMTRLDPAYRACFADGSTIMVRHGHEAMREEIARTCSAKDAAAFDDFVVWLRKLYDIEVPNFIDRNYGSVLDLVAKPVVAARLLALGGFGRLGPRVRRFFDDERLQRLFTFQAMYAGLPPESALAIYAVITYMDSIEGVYAPRGGMGAIPVAMARAAVDSGVAIHYGVTVAEVARDSRGVMGVVTSSGELVPAASVVCTLDLPSAYRSFLRDLPVPRAVRKGTYSPSAVVWHVGTSGPPTNGAVHHNIHFGQAWNASFDEMMRQGRLMSDPSRLVTVPSLSDPSVAAPGGSTLYVLEPVPNLSGHPDWSRERGPARDRLHAFLEREGYPSDVVVQELYDPTDWLRMGMAEGTPFSLAHTFGQTGPFRPANNPRALPGLVFAGSGTVPGVGLPMVLISGKLAADRVDEHVAARSGRAVRSKR